MERSWSDAARAALESYPWRSSADKARAREDAERVSFGAAVEVEDLPLEVRRWRRSRSGFPSGWVWKGESWKELTEGFERQILAQALERSGGFVARAARALDTTPRVVAYKARKYGLKTRSRADGEEN